jgi:hypothetical protein
MESCTIQVVKIVSLLLLMLENLDGGPGESEAKNERCVVKLITDDETAFADQSGQVEAVRRESHAHSDGVLHSQEFGNSFFKLSVDRQRPHL